MNYFIFTIFIFTILYLYIEFIYLYISFGNENILVQTIADCKEFMIGFLETFKDLHHISIIDTSPHLGALGMYVIQMHVSLYAA